MGGERGEKGREGGERRGARRGGEKVGRETEVRRGGEKGAKGRRTRWAKGGRTRWAKGGREGGERGGEGAKGGARRGAKEEERERDSEKRHVSVCRNLLSDQQWICQEEQMEPGIWRRPTSMHMSSSRNQDLKCTIDIGITFLLTMMPYKVLANY